MPSDTSAVLGGPRMVLPPIEIVAGPRFPDARPLERPEELAEFLDRLSPPTE
jgi:hypothetical protein